ncbi:unnamed protein product [Sphenostylis stenocarpa]|uniref:ABC1 atypical kinase-like domain-containing protein n=1 Tax=Sphenostylis stenocarpa TaxID=92480 RepID=A0AA86T441_9FABA|nr:unnamed protein product [Sphenostylis stenocarpa]
MIEKATWERQHELAADKIFALCSDLGGFFLKAPPTPFDEMKLVLENELGHDTHNVFERFDVEPLGSASIAQIRVKLLACYLIFIALNNWHHLDCAAATQVTGGVCDRLGTRGAKRRNIAEKQVSSLLDIRCKGLGNSGLLIFCMIIEQLTGYQVLMPFFSEHGRRLSFPLCEGYIFSEISFVLRDIVLFAVLDREQDYFAFAEGSKCMLPLQSAMEFANLDPLCNFDQRIKLLPLMMSGLGVQSYSNSAQVQEHVDEGVCTAHALDLVKGKGGTESALAFQQTLWNPQEVLY